jgi:Arc/MetJ-type ribon-helix-helix transcriptional regulator
MADTTTVKVQTSTRDLLLQIGASRRQSADQVIRDALDAMGRDETRQLAAAQARAIRDDPEDLAEIRAIREDLAALNES